jgi:signal transduction histidine kinase
MPGYRFGPVLGVVATAGMGAAFVIALLRYRLAEIDRLIARTAVYAIMVAGLVGVYVITVVTLGTLLQRMGATVFAAALIAIVFAPMREWAQRQVDRLLYGSRRNPYEALSTLSAQMDPGQHQEAETVLDVAVATVANAIRAPYAAIFLPGEETPVATNGVNPGSALSTIPLSFHGLDRGRLVVAQPGGRFSPADERFLADLSRQAAAAVHAVLIQRDLQHSREAIITTREEERRRLRRDLHDGLGPTLAAIGLRLEGTRQLIQHDPARAQAMIGDLKQDVRTTLEDLRRLVYALRPPSLDELGLVSALREQASAFACGPGIEALLVEIEAGPEIDGLAAAVEVAAYRIVTEALTNVSRHAQARHCRVRLWLDGDLQLEVADDGRGLPEGWRAGVGTHSMVERATELGGSCTVGLRDGGGTWVRASLPLTGAPE